MAWSNPIPQKNPKTPQLHPFDPFDPFDPIQVAFNTSAADFSASSGRLARPAKETILAPWKWRKSTNYPIETWDLGDFSLIESYKCQQQKQLDQQINFNVSKIKKSRILAANRRNLGFDTHQDWGTVL